MTTTNLKNASPQVTAGNPMGLCGVDFVEYSGASTSFFSQLFANWGFKNIAQSSHKDSPLKLFRQGEMNFIINNRVGSFAEQFGKSHGPAICSVGFRVANAENAFRLAVERGARPFAGNDWQIDGQPLRAIYGIGDSLVYFVDAEVENRIYNDLFHVPAGTEVVGFGFTIVDHFTNNVPVGEMQKWCDFYENIFNFRETRYFDIRGKQTGLISKVMRSPCGQFAVPINEPSDGKSQIQEYLDEYKGSGIQHLALLTPDILPSIKNLRDHDVSFLSPPPETYYRMLKDRLPNVTEDVDKLQKNAILVDGDHDGYLLQIFSKNIIGPIFFEVIERKGHDGFGNGNFQALFDAIEQDQRERGYL